ncbi:MAG: iron ABC transporter permease [Actinomycetota bacterium]
MTTQVRPPSEASPDDLRSSQASKIATAILFGVIAFFAINPGAIPEFRCSWYEVVTIVAVLTGGPIVASTIARNRNPQAGPLVRNHAFALPLAVATFGFLILMSLRCGSLEIDNATAWNALFDYDNTEQGQIVVRELRVPRTLLGAVAGACLAVAGAITQGVTRNPLGAPGILGVNTGASFAIVTAIFLGGIVTPAGYVWFAFLGAMGAAVLVYAVASVGAGGATPVKLALAGVVITALLGAWTTSLLLLDQETLDQARFWLAGSIAGRGTDELELLWPIVIVALIVGMALGRQVNLLSMGEDVAAGLGQRVALVRAISAIVVVLLAGSAVAIAGPVGFIGLAIPHMVRSLVGPDYRWILLYCLLLGPCLLLGADVVGRVVVRPSELQVGIVTAAVGAPFLIYLVRFTKLAEL